MKKLRTGMTAKKACAVLLCVLLVASCSMVGCSGGASSTSAASDDAATYRQISQQEAAQIMESDEDFVIVDVRTPEEYAAGHIPGAINLPNEEIADIAAEALPDKDQLILVYCRSGRRSVEASFTLANMGYTNVCEFGGINTWQGEIVTD